MELSDNNPSSVDENVLRISEAWPWLGVGVDPSHEYILSLTLAREVSPRK